MPSVCLAMIVKNEAHIIGRCLASVVPFMDYWVICDTGSTDETPTAIRRATGLTPGYVHHTPWTDFGANRTEALALARPHADYTLMLDADEILQCADQDWKRNLVLDGYHIPVLLGSTKFSRILLFNNLLPWRFDGAVHEHPECASALPCRIGTMSELSILSLGDGARHAPDAPNCYEADCALLAKATLEDPTDARASYYYAQTLMNCGRRAEAYNEFKRRSTLQGWDAETFCALWYSARLGEEAMEELGLSERDVLVEYFESWLHRPARAEPLYAIARLLRLAGLHVGAYRMAIAAQAIRSPADDLFVDTAIDQWGILLELSIAHYWIGKYTECIALSEHLLTVAPNWTHDCIRSNIMYAKEKECGI